MLVVDGQKHPSNNFKHISNKISIKSALSNCGYYTKPRGKPTNHEGLSSIDLYPARQDVL